MEAVEANALARRSHPCGGNSRRGSGRDCGVGMAEDIELLQELRGDVKDKRRAALLEAYIKQATAAATTRRLSLSLTQSRFSRGQTAAARLPSARPSNGCYMERL